MLMLLRILMISLTGLVLLYFFAFWFLRNPNFPWSIPDSTVSGEGVTKLSDQADPELLRQTVSYLSSIVPSRSSINPHSLETAAEYVARSLSREGCSVREQVYELRDRKYKNLICSFGPQDGPRVILGAHYDVHFDNNPGADDNASGVAALIELARLINKRAPNFSHRLDLVAYTLEEQPHFRSSDMGSYVHARQLADKSVDIKLMVSIEMIGYFSDTSGSQGYPNPLLKLFFPGRGNFIGVVGLAWDRGLVRRTRNLMTVSAQLPVYSINSPRFIPGIDLSDHRNFWKFKYPAVMVTDTAFHRNPNYHRPTDTADTLDYRRMALVVEGLYRVAIQF